jgi:hypothetical protein
MITNIQSQKIQFTQLLQQHSNMNGNHEQITSSSSNPHSSISSPIHSPTSLSSSLSPPIAPHHHTQTSIDQDNDICIPIPIIDESELELEEIPEENHEIKHELNLYSKNHSNELFNINRWGEVRKIDESKQGKKIAADKQHAQLIIDREREGKWVKMLSKWSKYEHTDTLKRRIRKGIPDSCRAAAWQNLTG